MAGQQDPRDFCVLDWATGQFAARRRRGQQHPCRRLGYRRWSDHPQLRFAGCEVSRRQSGIAWRARAAERGNTRCTLTSTETARCFYLANGYVEDGLPVGNFGTSSDYPMSKVLGSPSSRKQSRLDEVRSGSRATVWRCPRYVRPITAEEADIPVRLRPLINCGTDRTSRHSPWWGSKVFASPS